MVGQTISHYRVVSQLGSGGMGVVYEAEDTRLGRHVALKLLSPEAGCDPQAMDRFLREARIISSLTHPHICTLHDIGEHNGQQFMVMELLEGESLRQRIARGAIALEELLDLAAQIADALDAAHSHNVIHRDVKPANLFITRRGMAKVLDFGVAKLSEGERGETAGLDLTRASHEVTTSGSAIGTVAYMSPEQARGQELDARSDLFSFGVVLYEIATGKSPFAGPTPAVIFEGILTKTPPAPSELNAAIPPEFDRIVCKALEKNRETRYQSAAEMRADLKRLKRETETGRTAMPAEQLRAITGAKPAAVRAPRPRRALSIAALVVTIGAIAGFVFWRSQQAPALTARDTVVLADFTNRTGDGMFDGTLSEALAVQLRQSPYLNLLPEQQVSATLRLMGRDPMTAVTADVAREVCQRTAARATLGGTIASLGSSYVLTLRALDCVNGTTLAEEQVQADSKEKVLGALGTAASQFREKLGESLNMVQRYDTRVEEATTPSLEALKAYTQGMITRRSQGDFDSLPFFRRAIALDPNFALAHARLGTVLSNLGDRAEAEKAATRAYELREKVSERERLYIEARYYTTVARDQTKAIEAYRLLIATYPDDYAAHTNVGTLYRNRGMHKEAIASLEQAVRLAPEQPLTRTNLAGAYIDEGRVDDARKQYEEVLKLQDSISARNGLLVIATYLKDRALADAQIQAVRGRRDEVDMLLQRSLVALYRGRPAEAAKLSEDRLSRLQALNRLEFAGESLLVEAVNLAILGRKDLAAAELARVREHKLFQEGDTDERVALGGLLGDKRLAESNLDAAIAHIRRVSPPEDGDKAERAIRALAALAAGRNQDAYDLASAVGMDDPAHRNAILVAGTAAFKLGRWADAVRNFEALRGFGIKLGLSAVPGFVQVMLARSYAASGRTANARKAYEAAFDLWLDAEPDTPLFVEAKREYAALGS